MKILVMMPSGLLESIISFPIFCFLKKTYPHSKIYVLTEKSRKGLYAYQKDVDDLLIWDLSQGLLGLMRMIGTLRKEFFDLGFLCSHSPFWAAIMFASRIKKRIGYRKNGCSFFLNESLFLVGQRTDKHLSRIYLGLGLFLWKKDVLPKLSVQINVPVFEQREMKYHLTSQFRSLPKCFIAFGIGSGLKDAKNWSAERYRFLGLTLRKKYQAHILLLGSKKDSYDIQFIEAGTTDVFLSVTGDTDLKKIQIILSLCRLFVGSDTWLTHMASMLNIPVLALFGPTTPVHTRPQGLKTTVVYPPIACSPCFQKKCPLGTRQCMKNIGSEEVLRLCESILAESPVYD